MGALAVGDEFVGWFENLEGAHEILVNGHQRARVIELATVVGRGENSYQLFLGEELVAVFNNLMPAADEVEVLLLEERREDVCAKHVTHSTLVLAPAACLAVGVAPEQVAEDPVVGDGAGAVDLLDLVDGGEVGGEAAVHAEDAVADERGDGQAVEAVAEFLPQLDVVAPLALVEKAVDAVYGVGFVIPAQQEKVLRVFYLVREEETNGFDILLAPVDVVAEEKIVGGGGVAAPLEGAQQVVVLAVDVAADLQWGLELEEHGLFKEDLAAGVDEPYYFAFLQVDEFAGVVLADF